MIPKDKGNMQVTQKGNFVGGHLIGGDQINNTIFEISPTHALGCLLERLEKEMASGSAAQGLIDELKRFSEPVETNPLGIVKKLENGNRSDLIDYAMQAKEQFAKKLAKNTFFESAQEIHALLLSKIYSIFTHQIAPAIKRGEDRAIIDGMVRCLIIEPIVADLQQTPFRYYDEHVHGMLYYLTGNCYINWT